MNESLNLTNQMAELERRKIEWIHNMLRFGHLPKVTASTRHVHADGGYTTITLGPFTLDEFGTEFYVDRHSKMVEVYVAYSSIEDEILKLFPDKDIAKKLSDHVFDRWKQILEERDGKGNVFFNCYGDTKLSAGSADDSHSKF